jgi:hypothetical protein
VVVGAPAKVVRRWTPDQGWQPPLRSPAPSPIPADCTPEQLLALAALDEETLARLAELDEERSARVTVEPATPPSAPKRVREPAGE